VAVPPPSVPAGLARRAQMIVLLADGMTITDIAATVGMNRRHVYKWIQLFVQDGLEGLAEKPRRDRRIELLPPSLREPPRNLERDRAKVWRWRSWRASGKIGLHGAYALREHRAQAAVLLGWRGGYRTSNDGEGEKREGGRLLDEPVHRCLERAVRRCVPRRWRRGQIRGNPVCQGTPESRRGSPSLGPLSIKGMGFDMVIVEAI
jgi:hypothetical protein